MGLLRGSWVSCSVSVTCKHASCHPVRWSAIKSVSGWWFIYSGQTIVADRRSSRFTRLSSKAPRCMVDSTGQLAGCHCLYRQFSENSSRRTNAPNALLDYTTIENKFLSDCKFSTAMPMIARRTWFLNTELINQMVTESGWFSNCGHFLRTAISPTSGWPSVAAIINT